MKKDVCMRKKRRTKFSLRQEATPQYQYSSDGNDWHDLRWFVTTTWEAFAYLRGANIRGQIHVRRIEAHKQNRLYV